MVVFILILIGLSIFGLIFFVSYKINKFELLSRFNKGNVIVAGKKGKGKDLLFQYVINNRKKHYYSNIDYGNNYHNVKLKDVSTDLNNYETIVNDKIVKTPHKFLESTDIYISDIGIFLPSYMDSKLYKEFPSMPILYALSRHLYNSNIHCNTQNIERGWKALREQADTYIIVRSTTHIFNLFITRFTLYDKYESAKQNLLPLKKRMINKESKANYDLYNAQNGLIKNMYIIQFKRHLHYDTRAFEKMLLLGDRLTLEN